MQVFKFGGASVRDANAIKNVCRILTSQSAGPTVVVISAMGKTTNQLERVVDAYCNNDDKYVSILNNIVSQHLSVSNELFGDDSTLTNKKVKDHQNKVLAFFEENKSNNYPFIYDQVVSLGELLSTTIIEDYLVFQGVKSTWVDARSMIRTDNRYMSARVDFDVTHSLVRDKLEKMLKTNHVVTQGFIGATHERLTTTLAREGSDYSAAILAYCLDAEKVIVWKDVPGILNADPKMFENTIQLKELSFLEAIEMTFYGAKVIHPKTIKPLQNKQIPMEVRSFMNPETEGTIIKQEGFMTDIPPVIVMKQNQVLITLLEKDFDFVSQSGLGEIIQTFCNHEVKINMMQNGAISFSAVVDYNERKIANVIKDLEHMFKITRNEDLELLTIRHYNASKLEELTSSKEILLMQQTRNTVQVLMHN